MVTDSKWQWSQRSQQRLFVGLRKWLLGNAKQLWEQWTVYSVLYTHLSYTCISYLTKKPDSSPLFLCLLSSKTTSSIVQAPLHCLSFGSQALYLESGKFCFPMNIANFDKDTIRSLYCQYIVHYDTCMQKALHEANPLFCCEVNRLVRHSVTDFNAWQSSNSSYWKAYIECNV